MKLEVVKLAKTYAGRNTITEALTPLSFEVASGEFVSLLGPSGCGKSSVLQLIAGLDEPSDGEILLDGQPVRGPGRDRGMVFQSYTLFPWLTVAQNANFGARLDANRTGFDADRVASLLELVGLRDFLNAYPRELSGGMQQRVAIVRALANRPKLLLMDEPFGALDAQTREEMQGLMLLLQTREPSTVLFVTHDVEEAIYLSSRILVFSARPGRIVRDLRLPLEAAESRRPDLKLTAQFLEWKREVLRPLKGEAS
jgi:ABC-type nitrate/sulfonate/bicarbonate transport system ATPase subunit